jgi:hypothetical protein
LRLLEGSTLPLELALCLLQRHAFTLEGSSGLLESGSLLLKPSLRLLARALLLLELPLRAVALSVSSTLSCSASLAFSSAWLCQDRAPSRVARSCWSWARVEATSVFHSASTVRIAARSSRAFHSASSRSSSAVVTLSTAEASSAAWAPVDG